MDGPIKMEKDDIFDEHLGAINDNLKNQLNKMSDDLSRKNEKIKQLTTKIGLYKKQLHGLNDFYEVKLKFSDENYEKLLNENKLLKEQLNERMIEYSDMMKTKNQLIDSLNERLKVRDREIKDFQNVIKNIYENKPQLTIEDIRKSTKNDGETIVDTTSESTRTRRDSIESNSSGSIIFVEEVAKQTRRSQRRSITTTTNETNCDDDDDDDGDDGNDVDDDEDDDDDDNYEDDGKVTKEKTVNVKTVKINSPKRLRQKKRRKFNSKKKELRCKFEDCNLLFNTITELIRHKREHRKFKCKCNKLFMTKMTLRAHFRSAHGI